MVLFDLILPGVWVVLVVVEEQSLSWLVGM